MMSVLQLTRERRALPMAAAGLGAGRLDCRSRCWMPHGSPSVRPRAGPRVVVPVIRESLAPLLQTSMDRHELLPKICNAEVFCDAERGVGSGHRLPLPHPIQRTLQYSAVLH